MQVRRGSTILHAFQWTADEDQQEHPPWTEQAMDEGKLWYEDGGTPEVKLCMQSAQGIAKAVPYDWIVKDVDGTLYPCKPSVFEETFVPCGPPERTPFMAKLKEIIAKSKCLARQTH